MKKLIFITAIITATLSSCQKESNCRYCIETITIIEHPKPTTTHERVVWLCDQEFKKLANKTNLTTIGNTTIITNYKCK